ncbi:MAG: hypothetical protein DSY89_08370 [Deltaproteobacteria bacterium]|nr:MAG: hypothetical protein DSY89_08370 [Deltaproteobacteria bacterium]
MEHTESGAMVPLDAGWSDLGSGQSLWQEGEKDAGGNVMSGDIITCDVHHTYLHASHRLLAVMGLDRHIVVETADAVFVAPKDQILDVKQIVSQLQTAERCQVLVHRRAYRPWGRAEDHRANDFVYHLSNLIIIFYK